MGGGQYMSFVYNNSDDDIRIAVVIERKDAPVSKSLVIIKPK